MTGTPMRRREVLAIFGGAAAASPLAATAQQSAMPVIGYVRTGARELSEHLEMAFRQGLSETGYLEGRNVQIEYRFAEGRYDRLAGMVADFVRRRVAVIVAAGGGRPAVAAKAATSTIPVVS